MDDETFLTRFNNWEANLHKKARSDYSKYDALAALYLEATPEQRARLLDFLARYDTLSNHDRPTYQKLNPYEEMLGELTVYMRWDSKRIKTRGDVYPLQLGLAAAVIIGKGLDDRDVTVSLAFLYIAAKQAGLDAVAQFKEIAENARPEAKELIFNFLKRDEAKLRTELDLEYFYNVEEQFHPPYKEIDPR